MRSALLQIQKLFDEKPRPAHFTSFEHCEECADHDQVLKHYSREALPLAQLHNPGWDPICFVNAKAYRYLFPRLAELAFGQGTEYYLDQFLFHLENQLDAFSREEKVAIHALLMEIIESDDNSFDWDYNKPVIDRVSRKLEEDMD